MRTFILSKFQLGHWLSTSVIALLIWPLALALHLADWLEHPEAEFSTDNTTPADNGPAMRAGYGLQEHFTNCLFGRYWW